MGNVCSFRRRRIRLLSEEDGLRPLLSPLSHSRRSFSFDNTDFTNRQVDTDKYTTLTQARQSAKPYILVLIDGDGLIFQKDFFNCNDPDHPGRGGAEAARYLYSAIQHLEQNTSQFRDGEEITISQSSLSFSRTKAGGKGSSGYDSKLPIVVNIFLNRSGLWYALKGVRDTQFRAFWEEFCGAHELFSGRRLKPLSAHLHLLAGNPACKTIYAGISHDTGYASTLNSLQTERKLHNVVLLKGYEEVPPRIASFRLPTVSMPELFRTDRIVIMPTSVPSIFSPPTAEPSLLIDLDELPAGSQSPVKIDAVLVQAHDESTHLLDDVPEAQEDPAEAPVSTTDADAGATKVHDDSVNAQDDSSVPQETSTEVGEIPVENQEIAKVTLPVEGEAERTPVIPQDLVPEFSDIAPPDDTRSYAETTGVTEDSVDISTATTEVQDESLSISEHPAMSIDESVEPEREAPTVSTESRKSIRSRPPRSYSSALGQTAPKSILVTTPRPTSSVGPYRPPAQRAKEITARSQESDGSGWQVARSAPTRSQTVIYGQGTKRTKKSVREMNPGPCQWAQRNDLRETVRRLPCSAKKEGKCPEVNGKGPCIYGHKCPYGVRCNQPKDCRFKDVPGAHD
ncbi:hypothetical protein TREMEDRAFT_63843 [Tremella mesenterica DSM 1558]|uniref:uncharacterized protein n=1 Tax=Tremella mesenterica (strain ATCC 24925 / CBS 8224 / DSM 1558 / NBRC 9311 / NRRL Y-6157 / RJB 2259-6 / UBC 559-6) TaxID=578456 RepID=UPI0003F48DEA|nr:uncharacterized protein TREMEDRAFT_63843 [Tremella mesenterica DSM 1558]EIW67958.1 hypothetical protein TREMEDRAFT_63843 [Tremella mesenterica DSM 1558]